MGGRQRGTGRVGAAVGDPRKECGQCDPSGHGGAGGVSNLLAAAIALGDAPLGSGWVMRSVPHSPETARVP